MNHVRNHNSRIHAKLAVKAIGIRQRSLLCEADNFFTFPKGERFRAMVDIFFGTWVNEVFFTNI